MPLFLFWAREKRGNGGWDAAPCGLSGLGAGAHRVPQARLRGPCGPPQCSGAEPERAPHGSEYGENPFAPARMCRKKLCKNTETGIDKSVLLY